MPKFTEDGKMKVIVAIDDSPYSDELMKAVSSRQWGADTEFRILFVLESHDDLLNYLGEFGGEYNEKRKKAATKVCKGYKETLEQSVPNSLVYYDIRTGSPKAEIIDAAVEWSADKILIGSHGHRSCPHNLLGSVSRAITMHAPCTVEVIKKKSTKVTNPLVAGASTSNSESTKT